MTKHLSILGTLVGLLILCPALRADTFSPTYDFNGVITSTGTNPTCGASPGPCVETIHVSFEYYYGYSANPLNDVILVPGTYSAAASGELGPLEVTTWFYKNEPTSYYSEFLFPSGGGNPNEIDLDINTVANTFYAESFSCLGECQTLFGVGPEIDSIPTTLEYTVSTVTPTPEPTTLSLLLCAIFFLGVLHFASQAFKREDAKTRHAACLL
jgi:hypothetical protein